MSTEMKWAFVGDLQIPYHDKRAVALFFKAMKSWKPDSIDILGDIDDQLEYSTFSDGTTDEFFSQLKKNQAENAKALAKATKDAEPTDLVIPQYPVDPLPFVRENALGAREFYADLRKQHKDADIHSSLGNHDIRIFKYMNKKAPDYIDEITPNMLWGLDDVGITWRLYELPPLERFGGIHVHHGATVSASGLAVKSDIESYNISLARGHDHRGGVVYKTFPMTGQRLVGLGAGHMCDPSAYGLRYTINPSWELGFGIAHVVNGVASVQFIPISPDYTCVIDGKVFQG